MKAKLTSKILLGLSLLVSTLLYASTESHTEQDTTDNKNNETIYQKKQRNFNNKQSISQEKKRIRRILKQVDSKRLRRKIYHNLLKTIRANQKTLRGVGVKGRKTKRVNIQYVANGLAKINLENLESSIEQECQGNKKCINGALRALTTPLILTTEQAHILATKIRGEHKITITDKLLKEFRCETGLVRTIQHYGVEDYFSLANGVEQAYPSQQVINNPGVLAYNGGIGLSNYDTTLVNRQFGEEIKNLPMNIVLGRVFIGLENHGYNDRIYLGNFDNNTTTQDIFGEDVVNLNWSTSGIVHYSDFSNIVLNNGNTLKDYANNNGKFDLYIQDDTYVDSITIATCSKPNPIAEITHIIDKFKCSEKETMVTILGGTVDALTPPTDITTPRPNLVTIAQSNTSSIAPYDYTYYDYHFIDTLLINILPNQTITKAQFSIGYKAIGQIYGNDNLAIGEYGTNYTVGNLYNNQLTTQGWTVSNISNGESVAQTDLNITNTTGSGTVFDTMASNTYLDIYVQDDTAVDFTQLNLCVVQKPCGKDISIDLSQLNNWTSKPIGSEENNTVIGVWDDTLNWFDFSGIGSNEATLKIPFCACGDTDIRVAHFKADNNATISLDSTLIVSQQGYTQATMRRDDQGGNHVQGAGNIIGTGTGVNHTLQLNVHNFGGPFGTAVDGILNFRGYLGRCSHIIGNPIETNTPPTKY